MDKSWKSFGLRAKIYSNLKDNNEEDKKAKGIKKCVMKRKLKFQDYKNCLEACQIENKISHLQKTIIDVDSLKEFIKKKSTNIKNTARFKSERHNDFTEEINKIALSSNDDKKMQSVVLVETFAYAIKKDLVCNKPVIECNNRTKQ